MCLDPEHWESICLNDAPCLMITASREKVENTMIRQMGKDTEMLL